MFVKDSGHSQIYGSTADDYPAGNIIRSGTSYPFAEGSGTLKDLYFGISFNGASYVPATFNASTTAAALSVTCDTSANAFSYSLCFLYQSVFIPQPGSLSAFNNIGGMISSKPPFGYFTAINTALGGLNTSSTPAIDLSALTPVANVFQPFRDLMQWVFWVLFGFWLYNKFRHFKF